MQRGFVCCNGVLGRTAAHGDSRNQDLVKHRAGRAWRSSGAYPNGLEDHGAMSIERPRGCPHPSSGAPLQALRKCRRYHWPNFHRRPVRRRIRTDRRSPDTHPTRQVAPLSCCTALSACSKYRNRGHPRRRSGARVHWHTGVAGAMDTMKELCRRHCVVIADYQAEATRDFDELRDVQGVC